MMGPLGTASYNILKDFKDKYYLLYRTHPSVADDVFGGVLFCAVLFLHEMSWMRSETEQSQFMRIFLPTLESSRKIRLVDNFLSYTKKYIAAESQGQTCRLLSL